MKKIIFLLCLITIFVSAPTVSAATLIFSGAESGNNLVEQLNLLGTASISSSVSYAGTYSMRVNPTGTGTGSFSVRPVLYPGAGQLGAVLFNESNLFTCFHIRVDTLPASGMEEFFEVLNQANNIKFKLVFDSAGHIGAYDFSGTPKGTTTQAISTGVFNEVCTYTASGGGGIFEVLLNRTSVLSGTANLSTNNRFIRVGKQVNSSGQSVDYYFDNVILDNTAYPDVNSVITFAVPTGNGTYQQWTAGTGSSDYTSINSIPPNIASYIQSVNFNDKSTFTYPSSASQGISGNILAVLAITGPSEVTNGNSAYQVLTKSGATEATTTSTTALTTSFTQYRGMYFTTDPNTGGGWTTSALDSIQIGGIDALPADVQLRLTSAYLSVLYVPASAAVDVSTHFFNAVMSFWAPMIFW